MTIKKIILEILVVSFIAVPLLVSAQPQQPPGITTYAGIIDLITTITNWLLGILLAVAVIFLIYAAILYLSGTEDNVKKAKKLLVYAVIAIAIGVLAKGAITLIQVLVIGTPVQP